MFSLQTNRNQLETTGNVPNEEARGKPKQSTPYHSCCTRPFSCISYPKYQMAGLRRSITTCSIRRTSPNLPNRLRARTDNAYNWHLRLDHASLDQIRAMARLPYKLEFPETLRHKPSSMTYSACTGGNTIKSAHKDRLSAAPPGHTLSTDIGGPLPKIAAGHK